MEKIEGLSLKEDKFLMQKREIRSDVIQHYRRRRSLSVDSQHRQAHPEDCRQKRNFDWLNVETMQYYPSGDYRKAISTRTVLENVFKHLLEARVIAGAKANYELMSKINMVKEQNQLMKKAAKEKMETIEESQQKVRELVALRHQLEKEVQVTSEKLQEGKVKLLSLRTRNLQTVEVDM